MVGKPDSLGFTRKPPPSTFNYERDTATFTALLLMAVASTMLTVPMVAPRLERMKGVVTQAA